MSARPTLSPATRAGMFTTLLSSEKKAASPKGREIEEVVMYRCPDCRELHEWQDDAEDCCGEDEEQHPCPVCAKGCKDSHDAANCCLWKDLEPMARFRIACAVDAGSSWADAIAAEAA